MCRLLVLYDQMSREGQIRKAFNKQFTIVKLDTKELKQINPTNRINISWKNKKPQEKLKDFMRWAFNLRPFHLRFLKRFQS